MDEANLPDGGSEQITISYIKSPAFRTIHADGAYGGITPNGHVQMAVFSQRFPIPQETVHAVEGGRLGPEKSELRISRTGVVRELEANIVLTVATARSLSKWLEQKASEAESKIAPASPDQEAVHDTPERTRKGRRRK